jgi:hypothetical protein
MLVAALLGLIAMSFAPEIAPIELPRTSNVGKMTRK